MRHGLTRGHLPIWPHDEWRCRVVDFATKNEEEGEGNDTQ